MEKKGILGPTSGRRPGDVTFPLWSRGKGLAIDVAVTSPFTQKAIRAENPCEDYAAHQKHAKYDQSFRGKPYTFSALVFEHGHQRRRRKSFGSSCTVRREAPRSR